MLVPRFRRPVVFVAIIFAGSVASADAQSARKTDKALDQIVSAARHPGEAARKHRLIVQARPGLGQSLRARLSSEGRGIESEHPAIDGFTVELPISDIRRLCTSAVVAACSDDVRITATSAAGQLDSGPSSSFGRGASTHLKAADAVNSMLGNIGLESNAAGGKGVTIALIDSGLQPTRAFHNRIKAFYDFTDGRSRYQRRATDEYGHGTHVAGLIGGLQTHDDSAYQGVAPGVDFVVLKVLDADGSGRTSDVIRAIEFATANAGDAALGIDIINLSLGHPIYESAATDPLVQAVEAAARAGVIVVASAGNFGTNPVTGEIGYAGSTSPARTITKAPSPEMTTG
jgi:subtilisin family serine protease